MTVLKKIQEKGVRQSIRMISVKMKKKSAYSLSTPGAKRLQELKKCFRQNYKRVLIFDNHFGYYNIMLQRPQHLTRAISDPDTLVIYNSYYDVDFKNSDRITRLGKDFYIMDLFYYRHSLVEWIQSTGVKGTVMVYSTDTVSREQIEWYESQGMNLIYEYVDEINPDLIAPKKIEMILERQEYLLSNPNCITIATATKLYEEAKKKGTKVFLVTNGADLETFLSRKITQDQSYVSRLKKDRIKVGYYGALAGWVDYDLLRKIAEDGRFQVILIGIEHDDSLQKSGILKLDSVEYFGKKDYDKLCGYALLFDVCIIPFLKNEITMATSPVKLFEYMAMQKPIVTTNLPECKKYEVVMVAEDHQEFLNQLELANAKKDEVDFKEALLRCAEANSWRQKALEIMQLLEEDECARQNQ